MFGSEMRKLLFQVITSWQVIVVTVILVIYIFIVNHVANIYSQSTRKMFPSKPKKQKQEEMPAASENDELGLEEQSAEK